MNALANEREQHYLELMQKAAAQIVQLRTDLQAMQAAQHEPIAIIGLGCRFPQGADTPEKFWTLLRNGVHTVTAVPAQRLALADAYTPDPTVTNKTHIPYGSFLDGVDTFDAGFFGIAPREAMSMDPQQRLLLETSWEALEDAGLAPATLFNSNTGVFVGLCAHDYETLLAQQAPHLQNELYAVTGNASNIAAGRLAYTLGLTGPCMSIDTACSSSLVAVHQACLSLRNRECNLALAGGSNVIIHPALSITFSKSNMLAPDGRCKTFDAAADGYVRGEGCGIVLLKRLADAQADGDKIWAVIRGSAINHDGRSSGLTAPSGPAQQAVIRQAWHNGQVTADQVGYIEAHGTGTLLGDPIEIGALQALFGARQQPLWVGSIKTNIGHTEGAAGIASLIKVALALHHGEIPPHLHFQAPNPYIDWAASPIQVPTTPVPWPADQPLAGVSSFGLSGTNAHLVVAAAPEERQETGRQDKRAYHLLTLSAQREETLGDLAARYSAFLQDTPALNVADVCYTTQIGRSHFPHRFACVGQSAADLVQHLSADAVTARITGRDTPGARGGPATRPKLAFLFTGQGAQYVNMGRDLYETEPVFRATLERCDVLLQEQLGESILAVLFPDQTMDNGRRTTVALSSTVHRPLSIDDTTYTQPALFVLEVALATLWQAWGIKPDLMVGHSIGELAAACVAGVFSLKDGLKLVAARGRLIGALPQDGAMVAVTVDEAQAQHTIAPYADRVSIAAINGPHNLVLSGQCDALNAVAAALTVANRTIENQKSKIVRLSAHAEVKNLNVSHAFHSPLMEPILAEFRQVAATVTYHNPTLPLISSVTGQMAGDEITTPDYWVRHLRATVRFADSIQTLHARGVTIFLEIGPKPTLISLASEIMAKKPLHTKDTHAVTPSPGHPTFLPSLRQGRPDRQQMLESLGQLYVHGLEIDWATLHQTDACRKLRLPTYPFQRQRYWLPDPSPAIPTVGERVRPLIDRMVKSPVVKELIFESAFSTATLPFLADHRLFDVVVSPAACQLATVLSAAEVAYGAHAIQLLDILLPQPLVLLEATARPVQVVFTPLTTGETGLDAAFQFISFDDADRAVNCATHATGRLQTVTSVPTSLDLPALQQRCPTAQAIDDFYATAAAQHLSFGPTFRWLVERRVGQGEILARLHRPSGVDLAGYSLHPGLLDGCFQMAMAATASDATRTQLPFAITALRLYRPAVGDVWWCHAQQVAEQGWTIRLWDEAGQPVVEIQGFTTRPASADTVAHHEWRDWLYEVQWQLQPVATAAQAKLAGQTWLIFADAGGVGTALAEQLRTHNARPILVFAAAGSQRNGAVHRWAVQDDTYTLDPPTATAYQSLLALLPNLDRVVHLWSLDTAQPPAAPLVGAQHGWGSILPLVQGLLNRPEKCPSLCLVTRGAQAVTAADPLPGLAQSPLWGMGRVTALEYPELACRRLDLDPAMSAHGSATALLAELSTSTVDLPDEDQVAFRAGQRYAARLVQHTVTAGEQRPLAFDLPQRGSLDRIGWQPLTRRAPAADEVEIRVRAVGLNFRDILNVLGLYPGNPGLPGLECSGVVTAVGEDVQTFQVGDAVMALGNGCFNQLVTLKAQQIVHKPASLSFGEAATIPVAFLTAQLCLHQLAQMQRGERVLIHAASGGVGMAAVQLAQAVGAEVFATASPGKWEALQALGIQHLYNSRELTFADAILHDTAGRGVDLVLNSLTGPGFIEKSLSVLAPQGRFVEIGKRDVWSAAQVAAQRPDIRYFLVDLQEWLDQQPAVLQAMLTRLLTQFTNGVFKPLPHCPFPRERVGEAFRTMQQARHIGKLVITHPAEQAFTIRPDATYLITGGLGALGLQVAQWLAAQGAGHLLLVGRRPPAATAREQLTALTKMKVQVTVVQADVTDAGQIAQVLAEIDAAHPLRGIVHAAGVLADGALLHQNWEKFTEVLAPKVAGAWHLHQLTADGDYAPALDFFVCFSSLAGVVGKRGQASYAAANAFLDALAHYRHAQGLPALTIAWGAWAGAGMATQAEAELQQVGMTPLAPEQGLHLLAHLLRQPLPQVGAAPIRWATWLRQYQPAPPAFFSAFTAAQSAQPMPAAGPTLRTQLEQAPPRERYRRLLTCVQETVMQILRLAHPPAPHQGFTAMGLDSLMAVEVRNHLQRQLDCYLPPALLFNYPTVHDLTAYLVEQLPPAAEADTTPEHSDVTTADDHPVSPDDSDMDALIGAELQKLTRFL